MSPWSAKGDMAQQQYKREPLDDAQIDQLVKACQTFREKLLVWTLLDTGLRVSELAGLTKADLQWRVWISLGAGLPGQ